MKPRHQKIRCFYLKLVFQFFKVSVTLVVNTIFGLNSWEWCEYKLLYLALMNLKRKKIQVFLSSRLYLGKRKTQIEYANLNWNGVPKNLDFEISGSPNRDAAKNWYRVLSWSSFYFKPWEMWLLLNYGLKTSLLSFFDYFFCFFTYCSKNSDNHIYIY